MDKLKLETKLEDLTTVKKAISQIETSVNNLINKVNIPAESSTSETDGETGDTRVTLNPDKSYNFEIKTVDGWRSINPYNTKIRDGEWMFNQLTGDLDKGNMSSPTYAQDDDHMRKMEMEAYLKGNLLLRDFEDNFKY